MGSEIGRRNGDGICITTTCVPQSAVEKECLCRHRQRLTGKSRQRRVASHHFGVVGDQAPPPGVPLRPRQSHRLSADNRTHTQRFARHREIYRTRTHTHTQRASRWRLISRTHGVVNVSVANRACPPWKNNRILVRPCPLDYLDTQNAIKLSPPSNSGRKIWSRVWNVSCVVWRKNTRLWKRTISQRGGGEGKERGGKRYLRNRRESYKWR